MYSTRVLLCLCFAAFGAVALPAQEVYGSVRGTLLRATGTPIAGASVVLVGTAFSAVSDSQGSFQMSNVPAGQYAIRASSADSVAEWALRVIPGSVTATVLTIGSEESSADGAPLPPAVVRDREAGRFAIPGALLEALPIDEPRQALTLLPGVVLRGDDIGVGSGSSISLRGDVTGEAQVYVDGAPARDETTGMQGIAIATNAIEALGLTSGVGPIQAADARGGVFDYVTRSGGPRFQAELRAGTDGLFGSRSSVGYNRFEASLGGPVPGVSRLTWFASAALLGQSSPYLGLGAASQPSFELGGPDTTIQWTDVNGQAASATLPQFIQVSGTCDPQQNHGVDCRGLERPFAWITQRAGQAKVRYSYGAGSSVSVAGLSSDRERRFDPGAAIGDPALYSGTRAWSRLAVLNWAQRLPPVGAGSLVLKVNLSLGEDGRLSGPLDPASEVPTRDPALGIEFRTLRFTGMDSIPFPLTDRLIRNIRADGGLRVPFLNRTDLRNVQSYRLNPYGLLAGWPTQGVDARLSMVWERRLSARAEVGWQRKAHTLTVGVETNSAKASLYDAALLTEIGLDAFLIHPRRVGVFVADRVSLGTATVEVGGRYDHVSLGGRFPTVPGRIFTNPAWNPGAGTDDSAYANSVERVFTSPQSRDLVSPRLRLTLGLPGRTSVQIAFGQDVELRDWSHLFAYSNADLSFSTALGPVFGQDPGVVKSTTMEASATRNFGPRLALDVTLYHRDPAIPYGFQLAGFDDPANPGRTLNVFVPARIHGSVTGVDSRVEWTGGPAVRGAVSYTYERVSSPDLGHPLTQAVTAVAEAAVPANWRVGTVVGAALRGSHVAAVARLTSGLPYTQQNGSSLGSVIGDYSIDPGIAPIGPVNTARLPWLKSLDLRIARSIPAGRGRATIYADVRNLLASTNTLGGYRATGGTTNDLYRETILSPEFSNLQNEANANGALLSGGDVDLRACAAWSAPINCVALQRVEQRFGNGDGVYTLAEQTRALNAYYDAFFGPWRFLGPGRTLRIGIQWAF